MCFGNYISRLTYEEWGLDRLQIGYPTGQILTDCCSKISEKLETFLKDLLSLISLLEARATSPDQNIFQTSADNVYHQHQKWYDCTSMVYGWKYQYTQSSQICYQKQFNDYIVVEGLDYVFLQKVGTAVGASFSVTYFGNSCQIFMICSDLVEKIYWQWIFTSMDNILKQ